MAPKGGKQTDVSQLASNPGLVARMKDAARYMISGVTPNTWMSPGQPLTPMAPAGTERLWDFPVNYNARTNVQHKDDISFATLRRLSRSCDILRTVIERRKDQLECLNWQIRPRDNTEATPDDPRIVELEAFLRFPDKQLDWNTWLRKLLEDLFVLDAVSIYKRRDRKGRLYALDIYPGETIACKIDQAGRRPMAPDPAYQQIVKGVPICDFSTDELIYAPRNISAEDPIYGWSPVKNILGTINIALRRSASQLGYYTDGNISDGVFWLPPDWDINAVKNFQDWWDSIHEGNLNERRKAKFLPGVKDSYQHIVQPPLKDLYDEWLARLICFNFSIAPTPFIQQVNRATAESAHQAALEEGLAPLQSYIKSLIDRVILQDFGFTDLEFAWRDDAEQDPQVAAAIRKSDVSAGIISIDEARSQLGHDPRGGTANELGIVTQTGFIPLPSPEILAAQQAASLAGSRAAVENFKNPPPPQAEPDGKPEPEMDKGVGGGTLGKKWVDPLDTPAAKKCIAAIHSRTVTALDKTAAHVAAQLRGMAVLGKAADDEDKTRARANDAADQLNLEDLRDLKAISNPLHDVVMDSATATLSSVGVSLDDTALFGQVSQKSVAWAQAHAADLVTSITDTTREDLRETITKRMLAGDDINTIADSIRQNYAFSRDRATLIARTEAAFANGEGAQTGRVAARDMGLKIKKAWLDDPLACPICRTNADAGAIDIDDEFPSGDLTTPAHPRCSCSSISVFED